MHTHLPFIPKLAFVLIILLIAVATIYLGQDILIPFAFSILLSVLMLPIIKFLERKKIPKVLSIIIAIALSLSVALAIVYFLSSQIASFMTDMPTMKKQLNFHFYKLQNWATEHLNISYKQQDKLIADATQNMQSNGREIVGQSLISVSHVLMILLIIPVYCFLLAYYRLMIKNFLIDVFDDKHEQKVKEVITESKIIVQSYMIGLLVELAIVTVINAVGFILFGIKYAIFLGLLAAVLNMIPYIGMLIAAVLCMLITLSTSTNTNDVIWVGVILIVVQFIDNNIIMPNVVSSKLKINALISILGVLIGGAIAGVSGMFLSIPAIAIIKVVCDRVEGLKPWGKILGDDITVYDNSFSKKMQQVSFGFKKVKHKI